MNTAHKHHAGSFITAARFIAALLLILFSASIAQAQRIQPDHLTYLGAFRLPEDGTQSDWGYSGHAMTFYPGGDSSGPADGYTGSLFGIGHAWHMMVSEITIPAPVISATVNDHRLKAVASINS